MKKLKDLDCILLIDDEEVNNYLIEMLIAQTGIDVHVEAVLNGLSAIEYLTSSGKYASNKSNPQPGLIFLDINMPLMNGWEFLEEYMNRQLQKEAKRVIAMLTSSINPDDKEKAQQIEDLNSFISKPLTMEVLNKIIYENFQ